jgi:lia operon protein LiaG
MKKALALAVLTILVGPTPGAAQDRFSLNGDRIAIYNVAGEVRVEAGTGNNVVVEVTRGGADGNELHLDRRAESGWQLFVVRYPSNRIVYRKLSRFSRSEFSVRDDGIFGMRNLDPQLGDERINKGQGSVSGGERVRVAGSGRGLEAHADLRIEVPAGRVVAVHLGVGKITVTNVNGDLQLDARSASIEASGITGIGRFDTGSGSIGLRNASGNFGLHTGSGGVDVHEVQRGSLVVNTGSGSVNGSKLNVVELAVETGSGGVTMLDVNAPAARIRTGAGGIRAQRFGSRNFDLHTGSGSVRAQLASDVQSGRIDTGSGGVDVAITRELGAEITIDTGSGGIDFDAPGLVVNESRRSFLRGRIGDGNGALRVSTGSGGVSFRSY